VLYVAGVKLGGFVVLNSLEGCYQILAEMPEGIEATVLVQLESGGANSIKFLTMPRGS